METQMPLKRYIDFPCKRKSPSCISWYHKISIIILKWVFTHWDHINISVLLCNKDEDFLANKF